MTRESAVNQKIALIMIIVIKYTKFFKKKKEKKYVI